MILTTLVCSMQNVHCIHNNDLCILSFVKSNKGVRNTSIKNKTRVNLVRKTRSSMGLGFHIGIEILMKALTL